MTKPPNPFRWFDSSPEVIRLVVMMCVRYLPTNLWTRGDIWNPPTPVIAPPPGSTQAVPHRTAQASFGANSFEGQLSVAACS
jgi:hypothetical protein